jgi:hypothetical protein
MKPKFFLLLLLSLYIVNCTLIIEAQATVRYVSKTGSSTPPYTSWETASDSIQKCINISVDGDTIYVANGIYKENLVINTAISLIGSSMDSTIIDGRGLNSSTTIRYYSNSKLANFHIYSTNPDNGKSISSLFYNINGMNLRIENGYQGIFTGNSTSIFNNIIFINNKTAFQSECPDDTCNPIVTNSIILTKNSGIFSAINLSFGGNPIITNNIIIEEDNTLYEHTLRGISSDYVKGKTIKNNFVSGYQSANIKVGQIGSDTAYVINNTSLYAEPLTAVQNSSIVINSGEKTVLKNNIIAHGYRGIYCYGLDVTPEYNLFWDITQQTAGNINIGSGNFYADPMFVNDTLPSPAGNYDFHLQAFSPAIDKGDPDILDVDSTRSDIGMYGGTFGETYTYQDLAPRPPRNLSAVLDSNQVLLKWNHNTEGDTAYYKVYRDTVLNFTVDTTKLISSNVDTFLIQPIPTKIGKYYYKITCVDNQGNESNPSEEIVIDITSVSIDDYPMTINGYLLYQNYPNPFNPSTKIGYKLKSRGYVKVMVYDLKGELVTVLVNKEQTAGYYEVEFNVGNGLPSVPNMPSIASGVYLYRIEVIGDGNIPVYTEMKKMLLIK